jgi:hypothetical protein
MVVLSLKSNSLIDSYTGRTIFIIKCAMLGVSLMLVIQRHLVIIGTCLSGSYKLICGIDTFVTGSVGNFQASSSTTYLSNWHLMSYDIR